MSDQITYAKSGGPPDDWCGLRVFDLDTGREIADVQEVNTTLGWVVVLKRDESGEGVIADNGREFAFNRLNGNFEIRRPEEC